MDAHTHTVKAGEFKAHCLEMMDLVNRNKVEYVITKRGIPIAKLVPIDNTVVSPFGFMKDTVVFMKDIVEPLDIEWNAN